MIPINYAVAFFGLLLASIFDIKTREVPDWLNYSLIAFGFGSAIITSILYSTPIYILYSAIGFVFGMLVSFLFYYTGQWGGGDSKMLMGLGAILGFNISGGIPFIVVLLMNIFIVGALYSMGWSVFLAYKHKKEFKKTFSELVHSKKVMTYRKIITTITILGLVYFFFAPIMLKPVIIGLLVIIFFGFYFIIYSKAVEKSSMEKIILVSKLTEGDWVLERVTIKGEIHRFSREGISKKEIDMLKKSFKKKTIRIKEGIPFLPSFFLAYIITFLMGNWVILMV
ncbi:MAG: A24 family peptidase [archaeon]